MNIKTVLFITILLSIIGNYKGVQCSILDKYHLLFHENFIGMYHQRCFSLMLVLFSNAGFPKVPTQKRIDIIALYRGILRVYNIKSNYIGLRTMHIYYNLSVGISGETDYTVLQTDAVDVLNAIDGGTPIEFEYKSVTELIKYLNSCNNHFIELAKTLELFEPIFHDIIMSRGGLIYANELTFPVTIKYGYMMSLLKSDEIHIYLSVDETIQKLFIIDMMKEALINIFDVIISIMHGLKLDYIVNTHEEFRIIQDQQSYHGFALTILKAIYIKIIDTASVFVNIQENKEADPQTSNVPIQYVHINTAYNYFLHKFLAKWGQLSPESVNDDLNKYIGYLDLPIMNYFSGRLTERVGDSDYKLRISVYDYYIVVRSGIFESRINNAIIKDTKLKLLFETYVWIHILESYGKIMNADSFPRRQSTQDESSFSLMTNHFKNMLKP